MVGLELSHSFDVLMSYEEACGLEGYRDPGFYKRVNVTKHYGQNNSEGTPYNGKAPQLQDVGLIMVLSGYLKDSNAAAGSVDTDIFYVVINLSAHSKSYILTYIS